MDDNPWQVDTIEDFSYYKCPECSFEVRKQQVFQEHAIENHPLSYVFFGKKDEEEEFNDPLKIDNFASNAMVIMCEKLPNKKEIRSKMNLQATQSTENCEDNVSLSDELISESETKVEFCNEDKVKKFEMEKEFAIDSHQQARIKFCRDSNVTPDVKDIDVLPEIMDNS